MTGEILSPPMQQDTNKEPIVNVTRSTRYVWDKIHFGKGGEEGGGGKEGKGRGKERREGGLGRREG